MTNKCKNSLKHGSALLFTLLLLSITKAAEANYTSPDPFYNILTAFQDTNRVKATDTIPRRDSVNLFRRITDTIPQNDTIPPGDSTVLKNDTFNLKISKDTLSAPVTYQAEDSIVMVVKDKKIILFSKANVKYTDVDLSADSIDIDQETKMVTATFRRDTAGNIVGRPEMLQSDTKMTSDIIRYNFETQKGITTSTSTVQGEMFTQGEKVKKVSANEYFAYRAQITTCNLDTPHFAFRTKKMKLVSQKLAVSGPIHPEFEGVPVPIYLPFGFFPISQGRHSGLLPPQFTASEQFGLGLEGLGYYKVLNEYFDVTTRVNLYSYGGWALFVTPTYRKRYRYNGSLNFAMQRPRILTDNAKQEFNTARTFNITWSHTVDPRARPGVNFSANVNAGSTKFNQYIANNPIANFTNQLSSSITYSRTWSDKFNLTLSANHNQNNNTRIINVTLPTAAFTVNTFYPLQPKELVGNPKWYHKLGIGLNTNFANQVSFYDSLFNFKSIVDTMQWGAQHSVPIQLTLPPLGPLNISPGISFSERWYSRRFVRTLNQSLNKIDTSISKGFFSAREVAFSLGFNTALFGTLQGFGKNSKLMAIRHTMRPSVSLSYRPDLNSKDYYEIFLDTSENRKARFSYYDGNIFGPFSPGKFGGVSFGIDNVLAMKLRNPNDTTEGGIKRVNIIDGFGFNGGYNFIADSFKLSTFTLYVRSTLFEKVNITAGATLDPYQINENGDRIDRYAWQGGKFSPGRITNGNIAISTQFASKPKDADKARQQEALQEEMYGGPLTPEEQLQQLAFVRQNPGEFADFNVAWSLSFSFSYNFSRQFKRDYSGFETISNASFNFNGDFNLTPKWKVGMNGFYDITGSSLQTLTMFISREMHCWQLSINVTPVGLYRTFNITISPKSGILRDLRINRTRYFYQY
jgi:LPS-assembly protein